MKAFARVSLNPGEEKEVLLVLEADDLHFHDSDLNRVLPKGQYLVRVGGSSQSLSQPKTLKTMPTRVSSGPPAAAKSDGPLLAPIQGANNPSKGPNVLFLAIDDLRPELGAYASRVKTPNIDRLAESGMLFRRAYCQQAVCGASRLSIMGGLYPTLTKEQTFHVSGWRQRHPDILTLNQHFKNNGYRTIGLGKIYHGHSGPGVDPENWNQWINLPGGEHYAKEENLAILRKARQSQPANANNPVKGPLTESAGRTRRYLWGRQTGRQSGRTPPRPQEPKGLSLLSRRRFHQTPFTLRRSTEVLEPLPA